MDLFEIIKIHNEYGHTPVMIAGVMRFISLIPLIITFISVFKTYINKLHKINGLRPYRIAMMSILISAIIDQILFIYFDTLTFLSNKSGILIVQPQYLIFNSLVTLMAYYFLYFLFKHASKKDKLD